MTDLIFVLLVLIFIGAAFFINRLMVKQSLISDNSLVRSETMSKLINNIQQKEDDLREKRLMGNKRYRILKGFLAEEVKHIKSMTLKEAQNKIPQGQSVRTADGQEFEVVIRLNADLLALTSAAVKVTVYPKKLFGTFLGLEEWVYFKS